MYRKIVFISSFIAISIVLGYLVYQQYLDNVRSIKMESFIIDVSASFEDIGGTDNHFKHFENWQANGEKHFPQLLDSNARIKIKKELKSLGYADYADSLSFEFKPIDSLNSIAIQIDDSHFSSFENDSFSQLIGVRQRPKFDKKAFLKTLPTIGLVVLLLIALLLSAWLSYRNLSNKQKHLEAQNNFLNNMAHELRTPLSTASVALEAVQDFQVHEKPEQANQYIGSARTALKKLDFLVDESLSLIAQNEKKTLLNKELVDLNRLIEEAIDIVEPSAHLKNIQLNKQLDALQNIAEVDAFQLMPVFKNCIENAIKYSPQNTSISIESANKNGQFIFSCKDEGIGIAKKYHKQVFQKFFRVPTGNIHNIKGYGLGLAQAKQIIALHGGKIDLKSELGKGTTITIRLNLEN